MIATLRPLTYDDLLAMPDDGQRYEIIGGDLIVTPSPTANHQRVLLQLIWHLDAFVREHGGGELFVAPFDVQLGFHDIVEPDLLFIASEHGRVSGEQHKFDGPPDLVIEIISPSSRQTDRVTKMALYARSGVLEYWIADPVQRMLVINVLESEIYLPIEPDADGWFSSRALRGLRVNPADVFAGLD